MQNYEIIKELGKGGYGKALLAKSKKNGVLVCIKEIRLVGMKPSDREDALKEIKVLSALRHPYIVKYIESFQQNGNLHIVMEYADGGDLAQKIQRAGSKHFTEEEVLTDFVQIALAIKYIHDRRILHRDLKGQNIFLMKNGTVKLGDFGIARVLENTSQLCRTQIGTPFYLSPEICQGRPYNSKTDVWSLGCILYEMCTLKHAFEGGNMNLLFMNIIRGRYSPIPSSYSSDLRILIDKMLTKEPEKRPNINQIIHTPFIKERISKLLSETFTKYELFHTGDRSSPKKPAQSVLQKSSEDEQRKMMLLKQQEMQKRQDELQRRIREHRQREAEERQRIIERQRYEVKQRQREFEERQREIMENRRRGQQNMNGDAMKNALAQDNYAYVEEDVNQRKQKNPIDPYEDERRREFFRQKREAEENKRRAQQYMQGIEAKIALEQGYEQDSIQERPKKREVSDSERRREWEENRRAAQENRERYLRMERGEYDNAMEDRRKQWDEKMKKKRSNDSFEDGLPPPQKKQPMSDVEMREFIRKQRQEARENLEKIKAAAAGADFDFMEPDPPRKKSPFSKETSEDSSPRTDSAEKKHEITPEERRAAYNDQREARKRHIDSEKERDELAALEAELNAEAGPKSARRPPAKLLARLNKKKDTSPPPKPLTKKEGRKKRAVAQSSVQKERARIEKSEQEKEEAILEDKARFIEEALEIDTKELNEDDDFDMGSVQEEFEIGGKKVILPTGTGAESTNYRAEAIRAILEDAIGVDRIVELKEQISTADESTNVEGFFTGIEPQIVMLLKQLLVLDAL